MRWKIILTLALIIYLCPAAIAATPSLELTPEELVSLVNKVAETSSSWPLSGGVKKLLPAPERGGGRFAISINPVAAITGEVDQKSGKMTRYSADMTLNGPETIEALLSKTGAGPVKDYGRMYGAVCAALLLLNSDNTDEFSRARDECGKFFDVNEKSRSKNSQLRLNRHVSLRFSYANEAQPRNIKYGVEIFPTPKR